MAVPEKPPDRPFNYELERRLAAGGMGEVFLAKDKSSGKVCVIKRMLPNLMTDNQFVTMFLDEAKLASQLNHPNIAPLYDFGMAAGVLYLSMEYVPGANLRMIVKDHAARGAKVPFEPAARILSQAALALDYAHGAKTTDGKPLKLIHRDVSPQNILLSTSGVVKLIDFGVAKATTASQQTAAGLIKGKYAYMSPEQLRGQALDGRSDIFGLGLVLYELIAGERAIPGKTDAEVAQNALHMRFPPIENKRPDIPERLKQILGKALAKDVRERYQRAAEFSSDLERFLADRRTSPAAEELVELLPKTHAATATVAPAPPPAPPAAAAAAPPPPAAAKKQSMEKLWPPSQDTPPPFWENHPNANTEQSTEDGLPPTQQLTPSQLPIKSVSHKLDPSEAPTAFVEDVKLPPPPPAKARQPFPSSPRPSPAEASTQHVAMNVLPPPRASTKPPPPVPPSAPPPVMRFPMPAPMPPPPLPAEPVVSQSALQQAIRRSMLPWVISAMVLVFGTVALIWGFLYLQQKQQLPQIVKPVPLPVPVPVPVPTPTPTPTPVAPVVAAPAVDAGAAPVAVGQPPPKPGAVDSALVSVGSTIPAKVFVDGTANGRAPVELSLSPGTHKLVFEDLATGLKHQRVLTVSPGERRKESWNPERGKLVVRASPWAEIFVGDHSFGVTPIDPIEVVAGRHQFRFVNTDTKRTLQKVVDVPPHGEAMVKVDLR